MGHDYLVLCLYFASHNSFFCFRLLSWKSDGEAESYQGVKVTYVHGKTAILTIYNDQGKEQEKIVLHELKDRPAMHALMEEKGFRKKSAEEIEKIKQQRKLDKDAEQAAMQKRIDEHVERVRKAKEEREVRQKLSKEDSQAIRQQVLADLHNEREEKGDTAALLRRREKEELLAMAGPSDSSQFFMSIAGGAAMVGLTIIGCMSRRSKKMTVRSSRGRR